MHSVFRFPLILLSYCCCWLSLSTTTSYAFMIHTPITHGGGIHTSSSSFVVPTLSMMDEATTTTLAVATVDPTAFLTDLLGSFLNSPAILAIPIVAALSVASLIAFLIQAYATPQVEDDE